MLKNKTYLGDGVYAGFDGYYIVIYTSDGITDTNHIYLEPYAIRGLNEFSNRIYGPEFEQGRQG